MLLAALLMCYSTRSIIRRVIEMVDTNNMLRKGLMVMITHNAALVVNTHLLAGQQQHNTNNSGAMNHLVYTHACAAKNKKCSTLNTAHS